MKKSSTAQLSVSLVYDDSLDGWEGVAQYVKTLGAWLHRRGHKVSYLVGQSHSTKFNGDPVYSLSRNIRVVFNGNRLSVPLWSSSRKIKQSLQAENPDILHVQVPYSPIMAQKIINRYHGPVVGTFHIFPRSQFVELLARLLRLLYGRSIKKFFKIVSVSNAAQDFAKQAFGINSTVVPNLVDISRFKNQKQQNKPGHIVFLGRLVQRKGCHLLIKAFAEVVKGSPDAFLTIAGDGPDRKKLETLAASLGVADSVNFLGFIDEADKPKLLASAQIACYPSLYGESFGIVLIEAMAAGAGAVIGGNNPGYNFVLENNRKVLFNPEDSAGLANLLNKLLLDRQLLAKIHAHQAELVKKYDVDVVGSQLEELYRRAIAN